MDMQLLKNFLVLAKTKNFTKASQILYCSQSALSLQIAKLELLLEKPLFNRDKRNVSLTVFGEQLISYAHQMIELEKKMLHAFRKSKLTGKIRFGTPEDIATSYLPLILAEFTKLFPEIVLDVHCEFTRNLITSFEASEFDIVLIKEDPQNPHPQSETVWKESLYWVCKKDSICRVGEGETISLVLAPQPCIYRQRAIDALNNARYNWRITYSSPSVMGTIAAVKAGLGVSILPETMIPKELQIVTALPKLQKTQIGLLKKNNDEPVASFCRFIHEHVTVSKML